MAFSGDFEVLQGYDAATFSLHELSTGTDATITGRQIRLFKTDGTQLLPDGNTTGYIDWPLSAGTTIALTNILPRDLSLNIQVDWLTPAPTDGNTYTTAKVFVFKAYLEQFDYSLTQKMRASPDIVRDTYFMGNKGKLRTLLDNAVNAVLAANDQNNAQFNLDVAYRMQQNESILF